MMTAIEAILKVVAVGGTIGACPDGRLCTLLPDDDALLDALRHHKPALLHLLSCQWVIVQSDLIRGIAFWTPDDATREALISAGADPGVVYTKAELLRLANSPHSADITCRAKQLFSGRIL